jgi:ferritin
MALDRKSMKKFNDPQQYLVSFFIRVMLMILEAPESLIEELEQAIKLSQDQKQEVQQRIQRILKEKE